MDKELCIICREEIDASERDRLPDEAVCRR